MADAKQFLDADGLNEYNKQLNAKLDQKFLTKSVADESYLQDITAEGGTDVNIPGIPSAEVIDKNKIVFHHLKGDPGQDGKPGKDGINGIDGQPGEQGLPGENGQPGENGITPHIGDNGNWFIGDEDTNKPSRGIQGESGKDGNQGPRGPQGPAGDNHITMSFSEGTLTVNYWE